MAHQSGPSLAEQWEQRGGRLLLFALAAVVRRTPWRLSYALADALGLALYHLVPRFRRIPNGNLRLAFGASRSEAALQRLARRSLQNSCRTLVEFLKLPVLTPADLDRMVELEGTEHLDAALAHGRGAILLTAHYGNWEFLGARLITAGYPLSVIARDQDDEGITRLVNEARQGKGMRVLRRSEVREALKCLRRNEVLGILADQNTAVGGVFVDFFGKPAATAPGPALLALRTGAAVVPVFIRRESPGRHRAAIQPPLRLVHTGNRETDVVAHTALMTKVIEHQVAQWPEEWLWLHQRWKKRPPQEAGA